MPTYTATTVPPTTPNMYCQLTRAVVKAQLGLHPINGILGLSDDGTQVFYGTLEEQMGDMLEEGTVVKGHCYECKCENMNLTCTMIDNCVCPNFTVRCEGPCDAPEMIVEYEGNTTGIPPHCLPNNTCETYPCSTPHTCPTPWVEWTQCINCVKQRTRTCTSDCGDLCTNITTNEAEDCECTSLSTYTPTTYTPTTYTPTTYYCDSEHETWGCYNQTVRCHESCMMIHNREACVNNSINEDMPCNYSCRCDPPYARNANGECVKEEQCECYNGTIALPADYTENRTCEYCNCTMNEGYRCWPIPDCYPSSTLTPTTMPTTEMPTSVCYNPDQTPYKKYCNMTCYMDSNCKEVCTNFVENCTWTEDTCSNATHELSWVNVTDPCCPVCVTKPEICQRYVEHMQNLTFPKPKTQPEVICRSPELEVAVCRGACDWSESGGNHYAINLDASGIPLFDVDYYSDCKCCQADLATKDVKFVCDDGTEYNEIKVTEIIGCDCKQCV